MTDKSQNLIWRVSEQVSRRMAEKIDRELILAFHRGYDGMDLFDRGVGDIKFQPWHEENKPHRPPWAAHHHRYYFDGVTYQDLREAHEEIDNG